MAYQNINQYNFKKLYLLDKSEPQDFCLASDERDYKEEVIFSPYLIGENDGNVLPFSFDLNNPNSSQLFVLNYNSYVEENNLISSNYYNPKNEDLNCYGREYICDIGLTGIDNGLVDQMTGQTIAITKGLLSNAEKFDRLKFDRRLKLHQVTGHTIFPNTRFSGLPQSVSYNIVSEFNENIGVYNELYGGFYQGFYKLFGYDYELFPSRVNKGWSVELLLKPRFIDKFSPSGQTTLNKLYPNNKDIFFYFGTRAENKFYHHASGHPLTDTGYTRVTEGLECLSTCSCCATGETNSRCIYVYPPYSKDGVHDPHVNYGCDACKSRDTQTTDVCVCRCNPYPNCGWECQTHICPELPFIPTTTTTTIDCSCGTCSSCNPCDSCSLRNVTSVEDTCEKDPLFDAMSNVISLKLCGDPHNPKIGVRMLRFTGDCVTSGSCSTTGVTYQTGYTMDELCTPKGIYDYCEKINERYLSVEHWIQVNAVWERYEYIEGCDLYSKGGLGLITKLEYLDSLANDATKIIAPPYTNGCKPLEKIEIVSLNQNWLDEKNYRNGRLKIYVNGRIFHTFENIEEIIPRALNTDKEKQVGVPFNISWGGGTQGLHDNLTFKECPITLTGLTYQQDPENLPNNILSATTLSGLNTNIVIEQNFAGSFDGGISQFRMYTIPLSADEVKHNFLMLKDKFEMFNPDCPDCATVITSTTTEPPPTTTTTTQPRECDIQYIVLSNQFVPNDELLGRHYSSDPRDKNYLISSLLPKTITKPILTRYWKDDVWWGNQGSTPMCVGYAWAHWIEDGPVLHNGIHPIVSPITIYKEAQKVDEWYGENYNGTSVRAGAKYLRSTGRIQSYYWAFDVNTLINTVLNIGPVVVGTNWYRGMFYPDINGLIRVSGNLAGGHAYCINGVDIPRKLFRIKNSWGRSWGKNGYAFISFTDMSRLIKEYGEICLAVEKNF